MKQPVLSPEAFTRSAHYHYIRTHRGGSVSYRILLVAMLFFFVALPLVKVDVYSASRGILLPGNGRQLLTMNKTGRIRMSALEKKYYVRAGDTLLLLDSGELDAQRALCDAQVAELTAAVHDLSLLLDKPGEVRDLALCTAGYRSAFQQFLSDRQEHRIRVRKKKEEHRRYQRLLEKGVVARADYEKVRFEYRLARIGLSRFLRAARSTWQEAVKANEARLLELRSQSRQLRLSAREYCLTAPSDGHLVNIRVLEAGAFLPANTIVAELSPDATLFAECLVSPRDIGMVRPGQPVALVLDAYPITRWGSLEAVVEEVDKDVIYRDGIPVYRARCRIGQALPGNRHGFPAALKKGMTLTAQFKIARRTLWQLLFDKADDWLLPGREKSHPETLNPIAI